MKKMICFFDTEVGVQDKKIYDIGAIKNDGTNFHSSVIKDFFLFCQNSKYLCGHNIIHHDLKYLKKLTSITNFPIAIDTLYLSPLLFPKRPYHRLLKDDKLQTEELNNPLNDSQKASNLFYDEVNAFYKLSNNLKMIFCGLLYQFEEFNGFFDYVDFKPYKYNLIKLIQNTFKNKICENANIDVLINHYPIELAYALALINSDDRYSIIPPWLQCNFPNIDNVIKFLCNTPCNKTCDYCSDKLNIHKGLKEFFGFNNFREYNGEPLQENAVRAAVNGKSVLAVFPTGGGKSITFQLPALMAGKNSHGLTVVISPLQSLMKDQVDNLASKGIEDAVTINGMLNPIERADAIERVSNGKASLLYISPEMLRSKTIEKLLKSRNVVRFVIDEAHCFSAWGQDFRVDYLYIGDFIRKLQKSKESDKSFIPVSCFTATAKQKVITDICDYFKKKLDIDLEIYASSASRDNLQYSVLFKETDEDKYNTLRSLIAEKKCPTIVYVSRTKRTIEIAEKLTRDGLIALPYHGKMDSKDKILNQEAFMNGTVSIIVATSAFGMGVDKSDVKLVVHYDISDSLENYVQEAGRAGRDASIQAECYVLFNNNDLDKHFVLLNQTKLSISEIQQVWKAIKDLTKNRPNISCSALEIARQAGWDDSAGPEIETRVRTAISTLETAGYIVRGNNVPHVYATSIKAKNMSEASYKIRSSNLFSEKQKETALRIIKSLISSRSKQKGDIDAESRIDYLADTLALTKESVIESINLMRQDGLLDDCNDMSAFIFDTDNHHKSALILERFVKLERFILSKLVDTDGISFNFKELNEEAQNAGIQTSTVKNIRIILHYLTIKNYIVKEENREIFSAKISPLFNKKSVLDKFEKRLDICHFILNALYDKLDKQLNINNEEKPVTFSLVGLYKEYLNTPKLNLTTIPTTLSDIEDSILYLSKIGAVKLEGGFLVLYNAMEIKRIIKDNRIKYKVDDYRLLDEFYKQKIRQIHIVGEYANLMVKNYYAALQFVQDYFNMDFKRFINKYFKGERSIEIERNVTPTKYNQLFGEMSDKQSEIINDEESQYIVVAAGPGSGKTRVLVHKLASLLLLEDVKHEQLLMVTFSRAAATEFKKRLIKLIGNAANFVEIKTFHSYCFDLLGRIGNLEASLNVVKDAAKMIANGDVEQGKITKSVLVIDEAQDMDESEFALISALMKTNEDMRIIAVGDDDQNIYEFRGSNSKYLKQLINEFGANKYEMIENYRSASNIVAISNKFISIIKHRMKDIPCESVFEKNGLVRINRFASENMEESIVEDFIKDNNEGKTCFLTNTNEESLKILGILNKKGKRAKLIQSIDGFRLYNLLEIRYFLKVIDKNLYSPVISEDIWNNSKRLVFNKFKDSSCFENVKNLIKDFEKIYATKYRTDLEEFIKESNYEDFYDDNDKEIVYVSTIHKSKGREFDNVYIMLKNEQLLNDASRRKIYVGMTRAKNELHIYTNTNIFDGYKNDHVEFIINENEYNEPFEIMLQTTHKDVVLDFFKDKKEIIANLKCGIELKVDNIFLSTEINGRYIRIVKFSKSFIEKLELFANKGYTLKKSSIQFIVLWKNKDELDEIPIILANLSFVKQ